MATSPRTGPSPLVMSYLIPLALLAVVLAVLMDRGRFPTDDRIILIAVIAVAAKLYLRDRSLIAAALAFATISWVLDAGGASEWVAGALRAAFVEPDLGAPADFEQQLASQRGSRLLDEELRLYGYVAVNALAFATLLIGAQVLRRGSMPRPARQPKTTP